MKAWSFERGGGEFRGRGGGGWMKVRGPAIGQLDLSVSGVRER